MRPCFRLTLSFWQKPGLKKWLCGLIFQGFQRLQNWQKLTLFSFVKDIY